MPETPDLRAAAAEIEALVQEFSTLPDPRVRHKAEEIVRLLMQLYGSGLEKIVAAAVATADETPGAREKLLRRFTDDSLITSLLVLHELHPQDTETRILGALERVRPYLGSHGGNIKLLGVDTGIAHLRLEGSCDGCPSSDVTLKLAVEKAVLEAAPEIERIEVHGIGDVSKVISTAAPAEPSSSAEWVTLQKLPNFHGGNLAVAELVGRNILLCRVGEGLYAYENLCPFCGATFTKGALHENLLQCPKCSHAFDVRRAGQCVNREGTAMMPLPLIAEQDAIKIAIATPPV